MFNLTKQYKGSKVYIHAKNKHAIEEFGRIMGEVFHAKLRHNQSEVVFVCVGSDRITGDALGPLVGERLLPHSNVFFHVYGTLEMPVHAKNLVHVLDLIGKKHPDAMIVAIDACLGQKEHIGAVAIELCPLVPGAGVHKKLPPVGDVSIKGVVNFVIDTPYLKLEENQLQLHHTRLFLVMQMAEVIARGIINGYDRCLYNVTNI